MHFYQNSSWISKIFIFSINNDCHGERVQKSSRFERNSPKIKPKPKPFQRGQSHNNFGKVSSLINNIPMHFTVLDERRSVFSFEKLMGVYKRKKSFSAEQLIFPVEDL